MNGDYLNATAITRLTVRKDFYVKHGKYDIWVTIANENYMIDSFDTKNEAQEVAATVATALFNNMIVLGPDGNL